MSDKHIFMSYSRADGEFAQKLAEDLRNYGVNIWLDKIDIPVGARWDRAVEEALESCGRLLLIMTPTSVGSENVMDEVSEAFQNNKQIIPILYQPCEVPMRVRRLQYIDFTKDYNTAFTKLIQVVSLGEAGSESSSQAAPEPAQQAPVAPPHVETPSKPSGRRNMIIGIAAALLILIVAIIYLLPDDTQPEGDTSNNASASTSVPAGETSVAEVLDCSKEGDVQTPADTTADATINFTNHRSDEVFIHNLDKAGKWQHKGTLASNEEKTLPTNADHIWLVADGNDKCIGLFKMAADQNSVVIK